jgi:formiminoglutamate deiminase
MRLFAEHALLPDGPASDVSFDIDDGRFVRIEVGAEPHGAQRLPGVVLPGFANAHSHAFHRALRGRTHDQGGTFWTWRERMYSVASRLDPDSYLKLARATYAEMALAGITAVGEFHYLHHAPGGHPYADPNAMAECLRQAAAEAGIRLTLLDTAYLAGGLGPDGHLPLDEVQQRFSDGDISAWRSRVAELKPSPGMRVGAAIHSIRAVPIEALGDVVESTEQELRSRWDGEGGQLRRAPLHVHLSEQPAENEVSLACYGYTPTELLQSRGVLGAGTTAVHATHLTSSDVLTLGRTGTTACLCPTTERDLADGIGPARALLEAGSGLSLGSDQHAVIDLLEEARGLESHERLSSLRRGRFRPAELLSALTDHDSIGWPDAGRLEVGARADLVAVRLDTVRTAGIAPPQVVMVATSADVDTVMVGGRTVVAAGRHMLGDVAGLLEQAIRPIWEGL